MKKPQKIKVDKINKLLNKVRPHYKRSNFAVGGMVDYAQDNSQLFNLLEQFYSTNNDSNNISDESEQLIEEQDLLNDEQEQDLDEEVENETSLFGEDFLGLNNVSNNKSNNLYLPNYSDTDYTLTNTGGGATEHIVAKESGGRYDAMSPNSSAIGKYQFLWGTHGKRIQKLTGIKTREEFANNPQAQEDYYSHYINTEVKPQISKFKKGLSQYFPNITDDQIIAAYHFAGPGNLQNAIKTGNFDKALDANGTSILSYITPTKTNNMKRKKYLTGGEAAGIGQGVAQLAPAIMSIIDNLSTGYTNQPLVTNRQTAQYNPYSSDFGNKSLPMFAMGGNVPIEAEGDEVIQTPNGQTQQIQGPSHEEGGVDMDVPEGSKIYSDRLQIDGKSMADRKKSREKALSRLQKLAEKNPSDKILRNSLERTAEVLHMEEAKDMQMQEAAQQIMNPQEQQFKVGGQVRKKYALDTDGVDMETQYITYDEYGNPITASQQFSNNNFNNPITTSQPGNTLNDGLGLGEMIQLNLPKDYISPWTLPKDPNTPTYWSASGKSKKEFDESMGVFGGEYSEEELKPHTSYANAKKEKENENKSATNPTVGDYVGMAGNLFNAFAPLINTLNNRKGDKPNINAYKNFGKDALEANSQMKDYVAGQRENALTALRQQMNSSKAANRDNARSVNTIRALDLATDMGYGKGMNSIYDAFSQQMMGILSQQSQLENQQDQYVMAGEQARDLADRQDRDNFYTEKGKDLVNLGNNVQGFGKNLNTMQGNKDMNSLISQLSQFGLGFVRDENGNMVLSKVE
jgi:hypothetical protein